MDEAYLVPGETVLVFVLRATTREYRRDNMTGTEKWSMEVAAPSGMSKKINKN